jgi:TPR repeat protein
MLKYVLVAIVTAAASEQTVAASSFEDAVSAYQGGDDATAFLLLRPLAEGGDPAAQNDFGTLYEQGRDTPQDYSEAAKWYRRAAEQGDAVAQYNLVVMYARGRGIVQDYV